MGELTALRDALVNAGYQVIAADLPGSGRSGPQPRTYTGTYLHDDTQAFIALLDSLALGPAHLVGFSDGGEISLLIAGTSARHARSVVAWGAAGRLHDPQGFARAAMRNMVDNPIPPMQPFRDSLVAAYGEAHARIMTQSFADALDEMIAAGGELGWAVAEQIKCPALLITGEHDFLAPPPVLAQLGERLAQAETITAVGAGHDVHRSHSDWLVSTVVAWLQQH